MVHGVHGALLCAVILLVGCAEGQQYIGQFDAAVEFETYEDSPAWEGQLPPIGEAKRYSLSCFPKKADYFEMMPGGTFSYRPAPDAFSRSASDKDVMSYHGLVPPEVAARAPADHDCDNIDQDGGFCRTELVLIKIFIHPVNDAPVAANGESFLTFMRPEDVVEPNRLEDNEQWRALQPPFALVRELVAYDVDGDKLTYTITQQAENGWVEIVEDAVFKYTPVPFFSGQDTFEYEVDDSKGGYPPPNVPALTDRAKVVVQVGGVAGPPRPISSNFNLVEDGVLVGPLARGAYTGGLVDLLRYEVDTPPEHGRIEVLCSGMEVYDYASCATAPDEGNATAADGAAVPERRAYFEYTPFGDFFGEDSFSFTIALDGAEGRDDRPPEKPALVGLHVEAVNDPPSVSPSLVIAPMQAPEGSGYRAAAVNETYGVISIAVVDVDSDELWVWLWRDPNVENGTYPEGAAVYHGLGEDGLPTFEVPIPTLRGDLKIRAPNGYLELYYMAPPALRGRPLDVLQVQATDTVMTSAIVQYKVEVQCALGWRRGDPNADPALPGTCEACPPGHVSQVLDSTSCSPCPKGMFAPIGASECAFCPTATYQDTEGGVDCKPCGNHSTSQPGSEDVTDCMCVELFYGPRGGLCTACPRPGMANANTLDGADTRELDWTYCNEIGLEYPLPQWGFWIDARGPGDATVRECSPHSACLGLSSGADVPLVVDGDTCAEGYEGARCSQCSAGHYRHFGTCHTCRPKIRIFLTIVALACICLVPIVIKLTRYSHHFAAIDVVLIYTQVMGIFGQFYVNWPTTVERYLHAASAFNLNLDLLQVSCHYDWDFKTKFITQMLTPICMLVAMVAFMFLQILFVVFQRSCGRAIRARWPGVDESRLGRALVGREFKVAGVLAGRSLYDLRRKARVIVRSYLTFLHEAYIFLCLGVFAIFDCVKSHADGLYYLESEPSVQCWTMDSSSPWGDVFPWALAAFFVYPIGIFALFAWSLRWAKERLGEARTHDFLGFMLTQYKAEAYYYELMVLLRFFFLSLSTALNIDSTPGGAVRQVVIAAAVLMVAQVIKMQMKPFVYLRLNNMERLSLLSSFLILGASVTFVSPKVTDEFRATATSWCVLINGGTYVIFGVLLFYEFMPARFKTKASGLSGSDKKKMLAKKPSSRGTLFSRSSKMLKSGFRGGPSFWRRPEADKTAITSRLAVTGGVTFADHHLPEGLYDMFLPSERDVVDATPASRGDAEEISGTFGRLSRELEVIDEIRALCERVTFDQYVKPSAVNDLLMSMTKGTMADNIEAVEFIEEVMGETHLRERVRRHRSRAYGIKRASISRGTGESIEDYDVMKDIGTAYHHTDAADDKSERSAVSAAPGLEGVQRGPDGELDVYNNPMNFREDSLQHGTTYTAPSVDPDEVSVCERGDGKEAYLFDNGRSARSGTSCGSAPSRHVSGSAQYDSGSESDSDEDAVDY
eukprot:CAMPEP_0182867028 /NCGR_PEP_ID=MMETSP0034_2-20130328/8500_1 /TAXON_ID=156128 /ORGANISM="Nephroselmis pyriformis, Strain CCMP717" /LENGTH=1460 /DNA_ID=CAMNT_0024999361 /DNA_START=106 /DNA_END=4485 /DNA_ORIENTATION=+